MKSKQLFKMFIELIVIDISYGLYKCLNSEIRLKNYTGGMAIVTAVFCCVGALAITGSLHHIDKNLLGWWLCERQVKSGGLNGRPEKLPDVGYSFEKCYCKI
ncbi:hypothetical protein CsSME_00013131 [Camellia sinensis var. sinensis]